MKNNSRPFAVLIVIAFLTLFSVAASFADESATKSVFLSPEISGSLFVTDKGSLTIEDEGGGQSDVHTGDYNFFLHPALTAGYWKSPWSAAVRYAYPIQFAKLDLRHGGTADGIIRGTELGLEFAYDLSDSPSHRFYAFFSACMKVSGEADLDVKDNAGKKLYSPVFEPDRKMRNYTVLAGVGYDLKTTSRFSYGLKAELMYSSLDLVAPPVESGDITVDQERLEITVYSALIGIRGRFDLPLK